MDALAGVARNCLVLFGIVRNIVSYEALNSIAAVRTTVRLFASDQRATELRGTRGRHPASTCGVDSLLGQRAFDRIQAVMGVGQVQIMSVLHEHPPCRLQNLVRFAQEPLGFLQPGRGGLKFATACRCFGVSIPQKIVNGRASPFGSSLFLLPRIFGEASFDLHKRHGDVFQLERQWPQADARERPHARHSR